MTVVNANTRQQLMNAVPTETKECTCIGCGLKTAVDELASKKGGVIVLVTDGGENVSPYIKDQLKHLIEAEVRVVSIAFG